MKLEFTRDCLIFKPKDVRTPQDVEDLDALLSMMMNAYCCEVSDVAPSVLDAVEGHPFAAVAIEFDDGRASPRFRILGFERRKDFALKG